MPPTSRGERRSPVHHSPSALRWAREAAGWGQGELALAVGISPSHMSEIESGIKSARPVLLARIAYTLDCPVTMLERREQAA